MIVAFHFMHKENLAAAFGQFFCRLGQCNAVDRSNQFVVVAPELSRNRSVIQARRLIERNLAQSPLDKHRLSAERRDPFREPLLP